VRPRGVDGTLGERGGHERMSLGAVGCQVLTHSDPRSALGRELS
jgi:hypothetical protein